METKKEIKELAKRLEDLDYEPIHSPLKGFKTKSGEVITYKEAFKRWKTGMQNLTPIQRTFNDITSSIVILIGFIFCIFALLFFNKTFGLVTYGLIIIFLGNIYATVIKLFSLFGQYNLYKGIDNQLKEEEVKDGH